MKYFLIIIFVVIPAKSQISGDIKAGYSQTTGNIEKKNYSYGSQISHKISKNNAILKTEGIFSDSKGEKLQDSHLVYLLNIFNFTEKSGIYGKAEYFTDIFKGFEKRWTLGTGYLHNFYDKNNNYFRTRTGIQREYSKYTSDETKQKNSYLIGFQSRASIFSNLILESEFNLAISSKDLKDYKNDMYVSLISIINKKLSINLKYLLTYNKNPPNDKKKKDSIFDTSLVLSF